MHGGTLAERFRSAGLRAAAARMRAVNIQGDRGSINCSRGSKPLKAVAAELAVAPARHFSSSRMAHFRRDRGCTS
jgi:hypothetical protein